MPSRPIRACIVLATFVIATLLSLPTAAAFSGVRGIVRDENGQPVPKVCVFVADAASKGVVAAARTAADGSWSVVRVPRRGVIVGLQDCGGRGFAARLHGASQHLSLARVVYSGNRADTVMTRSPGRLEGSVTNDRGQPLTACVFVADAAPPNAYVASAVTDAAGQWLVAGLMPDSYIVGYADCGGTNYNTQLSSAVRPGERLTAVLDHSLGAWLDALSGSSTTPADVLFLGDSITEGFGVSDRSDRWVDVLRTDLQTAPGGTGYLPAHDNGMYPLPFDPVWTGSADAFIATGMALRSRVLDSEGDTAALVVTADRIWVHYVAQPGGGLLDVFVDGELVGRIDTESPVHDASARWDSGPMYLDAHAVELRAVADESGAYRPAVVQGAMVFAGDHDSGVRVWENGHATYSATQFGNDASWPSALEAVDPELVVITFGANDQLHYSAAQFESHLRDLVAVVRSNAPEPVSVALVAELRPSWVTSTVWSWYKSAQLRVAADLGLAYLDLDQVAARSGHSDEALMSDGVHPNVAGHEFMGTSVARLLTTGSSA